MDTGKIKPDLESAFREALFSSRPAPAKPSAGTAEGHQPGHPGKSGVIVNLSAAPRDAVRSAQQQVAEVRANLPLVIAERANIAARDTAVMARALQAAHSGDAGKAAEILTRIEEQPAPKASTARAQVAERGPLPVLVENRAPGAPMTPPRLSVEMIGRETAPTREAEMLARAMRVAHSGPAATIAQVLGHAEERVAVEMALRNPAEALSAQAAPARAQGATPQAAQPQPQPQALAASPAPDTGARIDPHAAQVAMVLTAAMTGTQSSADAAKAASAVSAPRAHAELITPMLVRQQPREEGPAPYLNQIIVGAALLGLVILLVL